MIGQLDKCLREASTLDGVLEFRNEHFWTIAFGTMVSFVLFPSLGAQCGSHKSPASQLYLPVANQRITMFRNFVYDRRVRCM